MTHEKSLKERKPFSRLYIHSQRDLSVCSILHMAAVFLPPSSHLTMAYAGQLVHVPVSKQRIKPAQKPPKGRCVYEIPHFSAQ